MKFSALFPHQINGDRRIGIMTWCSIFYIFNGISSPKSIGPRLQKKLMVSFSESKYKLGLFGSLYFYILIWEYKICVAIDSKNRFACVSALYVNFKLTLNIYFEIGCIKGMILMTWLSLWKRRFIRNLKSRVQCVYYFYIELIWGTWIYLNF